SERETGNVASQEAVFRAQVSFDIDKSRYFVSVFPGIKQCGQAAHTVADDHKAADIQGRNEQVGNMDQVVYSPNSIRGMRCRSAAWKVERDQRVVAQSLLARSNQKILLGTAHAVQKNKRGGRAGPNKVRDRQFKSLVRDLALLKDRIGHGFFRPPGSQIRSLQ